VFRGQADSCYPENSQQDGCYPDNAALPSRFRCWITGQAGSGSGRPERGGKMPRGPAADLAALDPRAGRPRGPRR
jgi:hypothetical protein